MNPGSYRTVMDLSPLIEPLEPRIAPATLSIANISISEGNSGTKNATFTVSLDAAATQDITVHYTTSDGSGTSGAKNGGDYNAVSGDLTFHTGDQHATFTVAVIGNTTAEPDKTFNVDLSNPVNATLGTSHATGTILNDDANISVADISLADGSSGTTNATFKLKLDYASALPITVHYTTADGTGANGAIAGTDYVAKSGDVTFQPGTTEQDVAVAINGSTTINPSKSFTLNLSSPTNAGLTNSSATATILNDDIPSGNISADHTQFTYTDVDGDLVTVKSSKALFTSESVVVSAFHFQASASDETRLQLDGIDFTKLNSTLQANSDLTFTVTKAGGGDGLVNVGYIKAATDLGSIIIPGDLGKITVGDNAATTQGLKLLDVKSMGGQGTSSGASDLISIVKGPVGTIHVRGDVTAAQLDIVNAGGVLGSGSIGLLQVDGSLVGGSSANSGEIKFDGTLKTATIGSITGGDGANSGSVQGNYNTLGKIGSITILGKAKGGAGQDSSVIIAIQGGSGQGSGSIVASNIANLVTGGNIQGGSGFASGTVQAGDTLTKANIAGSLIGGDYVDASHTAQYSGLIYAGTISSLTIDKDIQGKSGVGSGGIQGTTISYLELKGSLIGGTAGTPTQEGYSGSIRGETLRTVIIDGNIQGGSNSSSSLVGRESGAIQATSSFGSLKVGGSILGGSGFDSGYVNAPSLGSLSIGGNLTGSSGNGSGKVYVSNTIDTVLVGKNIEGGSGTGSGEIDGVGGIKSVTVGGDLAGGTGQSSGTIQSYGSSSGGLLANVTIKGSVVGCSGSQSGAISGGSLGKISIGKNLVGGGGNQSGEVFSNSTIDSVAIAGGITGGSGHMSGSIETHQGRINSVTVGLDVQGNTGAASGFINSDSIGSVKIGGIVRGGKGYSAGAVHSDQTEISSLSISGLEGGGGVDSGTVFGKGLSNAKIAGDVKGGSGMGSGTISVLGGDINGLVLNNLMGGTGSSSGTILTDGVLSGVKVLQDVVGGSTSASLDLSKSGYIQARQIASLIVGGSIKAGTTSGGALSDSGTVRATEDILSMTVGNLTGSSTNKVIISAEGFLGQASDLTTNVAIQNLTVTGSVSKAEILAGYGLMDSSNPDARGVAVNADAQIGNVVVGGNWDASSLVAGVIAGGDGLFGTADDALISGDSAYNNPSVYSKISSIIVKGSASGSSSANFGIDAEYIVSAKINGVSVPLKAGKQNDSLLSLGSGGHFHLNEVFVA